MNLSEILPKMLLLFREEQYSQRIKTLFGSSLIDYWPLWEPSGSVAYDQSGNNRNGATVNATRGLLGIGDGKTAAGPNGNSVLNGYAGGGFNAAFNGQEFAISMWSKVGAAAWADYTVGKKWIHLYVDGNNEFSIYRHTDDRIYGVYRAGGVTKTLAYVTPLGYCARTLSSTLNWFNIFVEVSKINDRFNLWVNGYPFTPIAGLGTWAGNLNSHYVAFGAGDDAGVNSWAGGLAHVAVWSGAGHPYTQADVNKIAYLGTPPSGGVCIMFDDGNQSAYSIAYPILQAAGIKATDYIISDSIDSGAQFQTSAELQTMNAAGWDIANHTKDHAHLDGLTEAQQEAELVACKAFLDGLGCTRASAHVSYPAGLWNANTLTAMAATGMVSGRLAAFGQIDPRSANIYNLPVMAIYDTTLLADMEAWALAAKTGNWICATLMHDINAAGNITTANFQAFVDYLVANNIPCYTISQVVPMIRPVY